MLTKEMKELAERKIRVEFEERRELLRRDLATIQGEMAKRGMGRPEALVKKVTERCQQELKARADIAFQAFDRVVSSFGEAYSEELAAQLKEEIARLVEPSHLEVEGVAKDIATRAGLGRLVGDVQDKLTDARIREFEKVRLEIDHRALSRASRLKRLGAPSDKDLIGELRASGLAEAEEIVAKLNSSAKALDQEPPDFNTCLGHVRVALETLGKAVAHAVASRLGESPEIAKWGPALSYLREKGVLTEQEERGLSGVYAFISPGSHDPLGGDDAEMAAQGRRLAVSMCYFLVRVYRPRYLGL